MADIFDQNGAHLGQIEVSEQQQKLLDSGAAVAVQFHTPQLLRNLIAIDAGKFELVKQDDKIVATDVAMFKRYLNLKADIDKANA